MPKDTKPTARQVTRRNERKEADAKAREESAANTYAIMGAPTMRERELMDRASSQGKLIRPGVAIANSKAAMKQLGIITAQEAKTAAIEEKAKDARVDKDLAARMEAAVPTGSIPVQNPGRNPFMTGTRRRKRKGGRKTRRRRA